MASTRSLRFSALWALVLACGSVSAAEPASLVVRPGASIILDTAPCIRPVVPAAGGAVEVARVADTRSYAVYTAPASQASPVQVTIESGTKPKADQTGCEGSVQKHFTLSNDRTPSVPDSALSKAFTILVTAFVLALLLESGFALLFNWRLFLEFFVGRAWRTPVMFVGAWLVVQVFDLDLMAALFDAYNPRADGVPSKGSGFTAALTAAILAGGSAGVNRIMIGLGFRSQIRPDMTGPALDESEAWIAIQVNGKPAQVHARVDIDVLDLTAEQKAAVPTTVGILRPRSVWQRLIQLLWPSRSRVPASGGRRVATANCYRITVRDLRTEGKLYDAMGKAIEKPTDAAPMRFGSRAVVDFEITLP